MQGGDGDQDTYAHEMLHACGPVVTKRGHPAFLGATKMSNNTGELSAAAELLLGLLDDSTAPPPATRGVIRPDSELAMGVMTGRVAVKENVALAKRVHELVAESEGEVRETGDPQMDQRPHRTCME